MLGMEKVFQQSWHQHHEADGCQKWPALPCWLKKKEGFPLKKMQTGWWLAKKGGAGSRLCVVLLHVSVCSTRINIIDTTKQKRSLRTHNLTGFAAFLNEIPSCASRVFAFATEKKKNYVGPSVVHQKQTTIIPMSAFKTHPKTHTCTICCPSCSIFQLPLPCVGLSYQYLHLTNPGSRLR